MTTRLLFLAGGLLLAGVARAQVAGPTFGLKFGNVAKLVQGADTLQQAWAGGLNTPQFSPIDLNGDGQLDLYAFDRETSRSYTFLNVVTSSGSRSYQYAPDYASLFPSGLVSWALLRDYDCDGRPDLFTYASGGNIRVFRNVAGSGGRPSFVLASPELDFTLSGYGPYNINIGPYNLPAIQDLDGDGRLDLVCYDFINSFRMEVYLNTSTGSCGGIASFERVSSYWGQLQACGDCGSYQLQGAAQCSTYRTQHTLGHNLTLLDLNGDGKLDLLDGRDNCSVLVRLLNNGSSNVNATFTAAGTSSAFPSAAAPVNLPVFVAAYQLDADFDGIPDLVLAPNMLDNTADLVSLRRCVQLYHNGANGASAVPSFSLANGAFLQGDMLDVSEGAMAAFGDLSGDGLPDMLVANASDQVNNYFRASLSYYLNVGTAARPVYRLQSDDYLGLGAAAAASRATFLSLRPALTDLNHDGRADLVYSAFDGTTSKLYFRLNTAAAGQPASFGTASTLQLQTSSGTFTGVQNDTPCFVDVDGDGYLDLLLGTNDVQDTSGGSLRYFRSQGAAATSVASQFVQVSNDYGQVRNGLSRPANLSVTVADFDGNGQADLLTIDGSSTITLYNDFRTQTSPFIGRTDLFYNALTGQYGTAPLGQGLTLRVAATAADLNQDGTPELYVGTETGGLVSLVRHTGAALATQPAAAAALALGLYPNPASQSATVSTAQPTRLRLLDLTGREVLADATLARTRQLDLRSLAAGVYLVRVTAADGTTTTQRLAVQQ